MASVATPRTTTTTTTSPRVVTARRPRNDLTAAFQKIMPYVVVVLVSMIAYYAINTPTVIPPQAQDQLNTLKDKGQEILGGAKEWSQDTYSDIKSKGEDLMDNIDLGELKDQAQDKFEDTLASAKDTFEAATEKAGETLEAAKEKVGETYEAAKGKAEDILGDIKERVETIEQSVSDALGHQTFDERFPYANRDEYTHWFPNPTLTGKVRDFFHKMVRGEIPDDYIMDSFNIKEEMWRLNNKERTDLVLQQIHFMDLRQVEFIVDKYLN